MLRMSSIFCLTAACIALSEVSTFHYLVVASHQMDIGFFAEQSSGQLGLIAHHIDMRQATKQHTPFNESRLAPFPGLSSVTTVM